MLNIDGIWSKIIRIEVIIALAQQIWSVAAIAISGGGVTAFISWIQGNSFGLGFPFYFAVFLIISILILILQNLIKRNYQNTCEIANKNKENYYDDDINFQFSAIDSFIDSKGFRFLSDSRYSFGETSDEDAGIYALSLVSEGIITLRASKIGRESTRNEYASYVSERKIAAADVDDFTISLLPEDSLESKLNGRYVLVHRNGDRYGKICFSLAEYVVNKYFVGLEFDSDKQEISREKNRP